MALGLTFMMNLAADLRNAADVLNQYSPGDLRGAPSEDVSRIQATLTQLGLHVPKTHEYYANGVGGDLAQRGLEMAQSLMPQQQEGGEFQTVIDQELVEKTVQETIALINKPDLSRYETMQLQQGLNFLAAIDQVDGNTGGRNNFAMHVGKVDGYKGPQSAGGIGGFVEKYDVAVEPGGPAARLLGRYDVVINRPVEEQPIPQPIPAAPAETPAQPGTDDVPKTDYNALELALSQSTITTDDIRIIQTELSKDYNPGGVDGVAGKNTINGTDGQSGLMGALKEDPGLLTSMSQDALLMVWEHASPANRAWLKDTWAETFPETSDRSGWVDDMTREGNLLASGEASRLDPAVYRVLDDERTMPDGRVVTCRYFVEKMYDEVEAYNASLEPGQIPLDPNLLVNQMLKESTDLVNGQWTPFTPNAESGKNAQGIAQFLPETGKRYGLMNEADRMNPDMAIPAMVQMVGENTQKFGSQRLSMAAYNGGAGSATKDGPVQWVQRELGKDDINEDDFLGFMAELNERLGPPADKSKWRHETYNYVRDTHSDYWDAAKLAESRRLEGLIELKDPPAAVVGDGSTMMASADPEPVPTVDPRTI